MKYFPLMLFLFLLHIPSSNAQIGVNISLPERGGTYIDLVKENYRWQKISGGEFTSSEVDAQGWPKRDARYIVDFRPVAEWVNEIDDPELYRLDVSGRYHCSLEGAASIRSVVDGVVENMTFDRNSNITTFDLVLPTGAKGLIILDFTQTRRRPGQATNTGFTNLKILRPGYRDDRALFHQPLIDILKEIHFSAIRFMNFTSTNGADPAYPQKTKWANRKLPTDASQSRISPIGKRGGACWEHVIQLANKTHTDPWINIPVSADRDYVMELAQLLKDSLDPSLHIYVESSNEVWNTAPGFEQTEYSRREAAVLGIDERENHGRRTAELAELFSGVFGQDAINDRVRVILCSHMPMLKWWVEPMLQYIQQTYGPPSDYIYGIASQTYFGGGREPNKGVSALLDACHTSIEEQIDDKGVNEAGRMQWIAKAEEWGLKGGYFSYEGGPDHGGGSRTNIANRIRAERDIRMCDMLKYNYDTAFNQIGGTLAMQFTLTSAYNRYGCWGLTDDINVPFRNYKMGCIKEMANRTTGATDIAAGTSKFEAYISPNPVGAAAQLHLSVPRSVGASVYLYSVYGERQKVFCGTVDAGEHAIGIPVAALPPGIYFLQCVHEGQWSNTIRLVKQ